jgi:pimeloyl-ACP methyl ester carboxylesterase
MSLRSSAPHRSHASRISSTIGTLMRACLVCVAISTIAAVTAGCDHGGSNASERAWTRVEFHATDGVRLDGRLFGAGRVGVVLAHMGRAGDTQADWGGLARRLATRGYLVLTYNRRGVCPRGGAGCSGGVDDYALAWKDVVGGNDFLLRRGARTTVVIGASIGAMASLHAAAEGRIEPAGLIEFGGINHASGYDFTRAEIRRIGGQKLFLSTREDIYGGGEAAREWFRWAAPPKRLELLPGSEHGTDLLQPRNPLRGRVEDLIVAFVEQAAPARS